MKKLKQVDVVDAWISNVGYSHSQSRSTANNYRQCLAKFCSFIGCTPQQIMKDYETLNDRRFKRKYAAYMRSFISEVMNEGFTPGSVKTTVASIRSFFKYNDLPLGFVPIAKNKIVYHNRDLQKNEILQILYASKPRDRAIFSMMAQSGLRPNTLRSLKLKHIEPEFSKGIMPCKIEIPEELTKGEFGSYFTFMGDDSVQYLRAYLNTRKGKLGPEDYLFTSKDSDKQLHPKAMTRTFRRKIMRLESKGLLEVKQKKAGKPRNVRLYNLRKYFRNHAGKAGIEYVNFWMGHRADYQASHIPKSDAHYFSREDVEFQRQLYRDHAMPHLRLEAATPSETEKTIEELRKEIEGLRQENLKLKKRLNGYILSDSQVQELLRRIEKLEKQAQKQR